MSALTVEVSSGFIFQKKIRKKCGFFLKSSFSVELFAFNELVKLIQLRL